MRPARGARLKLIGAVLCIIGLAIICKGVIDANKTQSDPSSRITAIIELAVGLLIGQPGGIMYYYGKTRVSLPYNPYETEVKTLTEYQKRAEMEEHTVQHRQKQRH